MCQPAPLTSCPTIKANARLRRSRQWKDQTENKSPNNKNNNADANAPATPVKAPKKNTRRRRRPTKKELAVKANNDCDASTASTAPCSDDSLSDATPIKKSNRNRTNSNANKNTNASPQRRKRSKKTKTTRPKTINIPVPTPEISEEEKAQYVALDAEMVGIGPDGFTSRLARVSLVNWSGDVIYDVHVKVEEPVTDYRTFVSGITKEDLESEEAVTFDEAQDAVLDHIYGKILVGHGLKNDFNVLGLVGELSHPWHDIRDTAKYEPFMKSCNPIESPTGSAFSPKKLKVLAKDKLGMIIQEEGEPHSPVEDAVAALELYKKHRGKWEKAMKYKMERTKEINMGKRIRSDSL